jgi:DNA repair photolyase
LFTNQRRQAIVFIEEKVVVGTSKDVVKRRGAGVNPASRFERIHSEADSDRQVSPDDRPSSLPILTTEIYRDDSRSVVTENQSPDIRFRYSLNPYRGCEHGCAYCYARPTHETLGLSPGLDFETKILAKPSAPRLLRDFLRRPSYTCEPIVLSGVTDPYQPIERQLRITRQCLEVMLSCRHPVEIITKSRLILRDVDLLQSLARQNLLAVSIAVTTLDENLQYAMEPRASSPLARLDTIKQLTQAGIPVRLLIAPVIPGLTDSEIPSILKTARLCGVREASYTLLRLPSSVKEVFIEWIERHYPTKAPAVLARVRDVRGGKLNDSRFGSRMRGTGHWADQIAKLFQVFTRLQGLDHSLPPLDTSQFQVPADPSGQLTLF